MKRLLILLLFTRVVFAQEPRIIEIKSQQFLYTPSIIKVKEGESVIFRFRSLVLPTVFSLMGIG